VRFALVLGVALAALGCGGGAASSKPAQHAKAPAQTCDAIGASVVKFSELVEDAGASAKGRMGSYAGFLELLVTFERASADLEAELGALRAPDADTKAALDKAASALARAKEFAKTEREAVERHAREVAPLAKETQEAWAALRAACNAKKPTGDCAAVQAIVVRYDKAETSNDHVKVIDDLASMRTGPTLSKTRDRAVSASRTVQAAIASRSEATAALPRRWGVVQKDVEGAMSAVAQRCPGTKLDSAAKFTAADRPDPRKLTVLVKVKPPAKVEQTFVDLAQHTQDEDEKAFYEARAKGAFGSGFVVVRSGEVMVITNRHVVDLGDRAALELADGSQLGSADIVYTDPVRDVAILRPTTKVPVTHGFAFAALPAKDQQVVIATGFPGLVGRPAYQTTRGYVSNESLRLDENAPKLTYVQHTAPIDPGSSGGPLTDEKGHVLGVNTLKVTNREAVGLAVPSKAILETIRRSDAMEKTSKSAAHRREGARLACLGFIAELSSKQPRLEALEPMISNLLTGAEGLEAAAALEGDETFDRIWQADSVRAMRIATLVRVRAVVLSGGGPSVLETCNEANPEDVASILTSQQVRFKIRLATFDTRELAVRFEQGHWKLSAFDVSTHAAPPKKKTPTPPKRKK
jgi:S1-C subfamily serine protease